MDPILDCHDVRPQQRKALFLSRLAELQDGQGFILLCRGSVSDLLALMEQEHPGRFAWYRLSDVPDDLAVLITQRAPRATSAIVKLLQDDQHGIDALAAWLAVAAEQGQAGRVVVLAHQLESRLTEHLRREEELVLPVLSRRLAGARHLVQRLREEHQQGLQLARLISRTLATVGNHAGLEHLWRRASTLQSLLRTHSRFEDGLFYRLADVLLAPADQQELLQGYREPDAPAPV